MRDDWSWIGNWSLQRALLTPHREAIVDATTGQRLTFYDINLRANKLAHVLLDYGIGKGDRVACYAKNRIEYIDLAFACGKIGAVLVPLNIRLAPREIEFLVDKTSPSLMIYDPTLISQFNRFRDKLSKQQIIVMGDCDIDGDSSLQSLVKKASSSQPERPTLQFEDPYLILFTGGTTGLPKGAVLSHRLVFWNSVNTIVSWGLRPDDVQPLLFPLFHTGGWNVLFFPFYHIGAKTLLMGDFDAGKTIEVIEKEQCTIVIGVPTMFQMIAEHEHFSKANFDSVRVFISGGAPCPVAIMEKYWARGKYFKMGYGLTEVGPNNFYLPESEIRRKPNSVGFPVFHCETKIVDENGNPVPQGEIGELLLRGPHIFSGYWEESEETAKTIEPDDWVHTGDLAKVDDEGFYYIVGRSKDMYISGGENVYPTEIEELLYQHPAILEAAVVGIPDEKWGEVGKAVIVPKPGNTLTAEEIRSYLNGKLAKYKIPKVYEFRKSLPKSAAGKILKRELV